MDWTHRLRLRHLQMLVSLAETRNVSRSAALMNTTQPGLSKWLRDLEADVGLPLFERYARGLRPTAYGESLLAYARRIEAELDRGRDEMSSLRAGNSGRVVIGTSGAAASDATPAAVQRLLAAMPQVSVEIVENTMDKLIETLRRGELDLVVGRSSAEHGHPSLVAEDLYAENVHFVTRVGHPLHRRRAPEWRDLAHYRWLLWPQGTPIRTIFDAALLKAGQTIPPNHVASNSVASNLTLLYSSDMVGVLSDRAAMRYEKLKIVRRLPLHLDTHGTVTMYWRADALKTAVVEETIACLRRVAGDHEAA